MLRLQLEQLHFMTKSSEWPPLTHPPTGEPSNAPYFEAFQQRWKVFSNSNQRPPAKEACVTSPENMEEFFPHTLRANAKKVVNAYRSAKSSGATSSFVWSVPLFEFADQVYKEVFSGFEGVLGDRYNDDYMTRYEEYMDRVGANNFEHWETMEQHFKSFLRSFQGSSQLSSQGSSQGSSQEPSAVSSSRDIVAVRQAKRKWDYFVWMQDNDLLPALPLPTATFLRDYAALVESMQWGLYTVSH